MATNYNYPDPTNIEAAAQYRPGVASRLFNVLTGGLGGAITGTTERGQEAARARQALLQEEFQKRDEQRALERQLMINALQSGVETPVGQTFDEKMADFRQKMIRSQLAAVEGAKYGALSPTGPYPSPLQSEPQFQIAAGKSQAELARRAAELQQTEDIQGTKYSGMITGMGGKVTPGASAGELAGQLELVRSGLPTRQKAQLARADLATLRNLNAFPSPVDINALSDEEAIAQAELFGKKYYNESYLTAFQKRQEAESANVVKFNELLANPNADKTALKQAYFNLPADAQKDEGYRIAAGVPRPATPKEKESLTSYIDSVDKSSNLAKSISYLAGTGEIAKVSQQNFNGFNSWLRGFQNRFGSEDPRFQSINNVVQEFQRLIAEQRKSFFGASLTDNEFRVAKELFADPNQANFLPRVINLVDSIMSKDVIGRQYDRNGIFVDNQTRQEVQDARNQWLQTKEKYNFGGLGATNTGMPSNKMSRLEELRRKKAQQ